MDQGPLTRTIKADGSDDVLWSSKESINVFYGSSGSRFVSSNTEPAATVSFSGTLSSFTGTTSTGESLQFWAVYPYHKENAYSNSSVSAYLPSTQSCSVGNFPDKTRLMVAKSSGLVLSFGQVCSMLRINIPSDCGDITRITLRGNHEEILAGRVSVSFDSNGDPTWSVIEGEGDKVITFLPSGSSTFAAGDYYLPLLPQTLQNGYTITYYRTETYGSKSTSSAALFERNKVDRATSAKQVTTWTPLEHPSNEIWYTTSDGCAAQYNTGADYADEIEIVAPSDNDGIGIVRFPSAIKTIPTDAFNAALAGDNNRKITSFILPETVETLSEGAFANCNALTSIQMDGVKYIRTNAFYGCGFETLSLHEGLVGISSSAFQWCDELRSVEIPESVTTLSYPYYFWENPFLSCLALESFSGKFATDDGLALLSGNGAGQRDVLVAFATGALEGGTYTVPDGVKSISMYAFSRSKLAEVNLNEVTYLFDCALCDSGLKRVHIPSTVTGLGDYALANCPDLESIRIDVTTSLPSIGTNVFDSSTCPIYVPAAWLEVFKTADRWSAYADRYQALPASNEIRYTTTDGQPVNVNFIDKGYPSAWTITNTYENGQGVISFKMPSGSPISIDQIRAGTFLEATNLKTVLLPEYVQVIGDLAFSCCYDLTSVQLGSRTLSIGEHAFEACERLTDINLPEGLLYIENEAFKSCTSLETVTLPGSIAGIGVNLSGNEVVSEHVHNPFSGCVNLKGFYGSGNSYYKISDDHRFLLSADGKFLFSGAMGGFDGVRCQIPIGVETIGMSAFYMGKSAQIGFTDSLKEIGDYAFFSCTLQAGPIYLPKTLNSIGQGAFQGITIQNSDDYIRLQGDNLPILGSAAFGDTDTYPIQITGMATLDNKLGNNDNPWFPYWFGKRICPYQEHDEIWYHTTATHVSRITQSLNFGTDELPLYPSEYNGFVFYTNQFGTSSPLIPFPEQGYTYVAICKFDQPVQSVPAEAFMGRNDLDYISIGNFVTRIGDRAFSGCSALKYFPVLAPDMSVNSIGEAAFQGCENMESSAWSDVLFLKNVTSVGNSAFNSCKKLKEVVLGQIPYFSSYSFGNCENLESVWITDAANTANAVNSIQDIGIAAFLNCPNLKRIDSWANTSSQSINLPAATYVFQQAFKGCSTIESVKLGAVTVIGESAFEECVALQGVLYQGSALTTIGNNAFYNCQEFVSLGTVEGRTLVVIPSVTSIGTSAFANTHIRSVSANNALSIGASAFADCSILAGVTVPKATTLSSNCFLNDVNLTSVDVSNATLVQARAFDGCTKLASLSLPSVEIIGDKAFAYTRSLTTLDLGQNLEKFGNEVFFDDNASLRNTNKLSIYLRGSRWYYNWDDAGSVYNWDIYDAFNYNLAESGAWFQFKNIYVPSQISADFDQSVQYSFGTGNYIQSL